VEVEDKKNRKNNLVNKIGMKEDKVNGEQFGQAIKC